jgi:hypothetical protein
MHSNAKYDNNVGSKQPRLCCVHNLKSGLYSYHTEKIMHKFHIFQYLALKVGERYVFIFYPNQMYFSGLFIFIKCVKYDLEIFLENNFV